MAEQKTVGPAHEPVKDVVADCDWRAEIKQRPLAWSLGALGVGLLAGCAISDACKRRRGKHQRPGVVPSVPHAYAALPIVGEHRSGTVPEQKVNAVASETRKREQLKGHAAADPLRQEFENLRDRFVLELSTIAHQVLLPALIRKIREALVADQPKPESLRRGGIHQ